MLKNLLGKKKDNYFLEIPEESNDKKNTKTTKQTSKAESKSEAKTVTITEPKVAKKVINTDQPEWVKAIKNYTNQTGKVEKKESQTFSTTYLMPTISPFRRRPGPSLNGFKDMANNMNK